MNKSSNHTPGRPTHVEYVGYHKAMPATPASFPASVAMSAWMAGDGPNK